MAERNPAFDAYVIVDWSANSKPKTGPDSIWWVVQEWVDARFADQLPAVLTEEGWIRGV